MAQVLDANNNIVGFSATAPIPSRRTSFSPRIDYQINANHTLVARYNYTKNTRIVGVGGFSLPSRAYDTENSEQSIQFTETAIINKTIVNETRFEFEHSNSEQNADNSVSRLSTCRTPSRVVDLRWVSQTPPKQTGNSRNNTSFALKTITPSKSVRASVRLISRNSRRRISAALSLSLVASLARRRLVQITNPWDGIVSLPSIERYRRTEVLLDAGIYGRSDTSSRRRRNSVSFVFR